MNIHKINSGGDPLLSAGQREDEQRADLKRSTLFRHQQTLNTQYSTLNTQVEEQFLLRRNGRAASQS
jgi:hypothetical protein